MPSVSRTSPVYPVLHGRDKSGWRSGFEINIHSSTVRLKIKLIRLGGGGGRGDEITKRDAILEQIRGEREKQSERQRTMGISFSGDGRLSREVNSVSLVCCHFSSVSSSLVDRGIFFFFSFRMAEKLFIIIDFCTRQVGWMLFRSMLG